MTTPQPSPPTAEERNLYYYGIPSAPSLVARSSSHVWVNPQNPDMASSPWTGTHRMYPKTLHTVGKHPLLHRLWNDPESSLRGKILEALSGTDWTAVDFLRISLNKEYQITLMVTVRPDTLTWSQGHPITLRCKSILEEQGIYDVHCEILESVVHFYTEATSRTYSTTDSGVKTDPPSKTPATFQLSSGPIPKGENANTWAQLSDRLGTIISTSPLDGITGTKSLYLSIPPSSTGGEPRIAALTCRHVVIDSKKEGTQMYQQSQQCKEVIQVDQWTYDWRLRCIGDSVKRRLEAAELRSMTGQTAAPSLTNLSNEAMVLEQAMKPFEDASSRVFGRLLYSPEFATTSSVPGCAWLRDWALIELLPKNHQAPLGLIQNKVYVGSLDDFLCTFSKSKGYYNQVLSSGDLEMEDGELQLQTAVVPMNEIFHSPYMDYTSESGLCVGKYGAKGGLSFGRGNTLISVVRHVETLEGGRKEEFISEGWAIISASGGRNNVQEPFAGEGDSSSCIWDMQGRPAGIITAGNSAYAMWSHITYAQPLERLLTDIRSHGFDVSLV
ncbi:uncharacterized protein TRIVIDRAFT_68435 [Trichoderma virens Gv29-8]|uniref:Uncharacterized protein n=1 Tax=Hypocrea virens (strain Gv29-8 / FGSC 10586) TaxID=413071 RepID=G9N488_HYPVG|nr:uncharacterized protein TRIVIDRAFT_68435 [Trichoderma virens Gv29-8]EHK18414.1 hypothetical protein TRIVIDRAFT_68435 [Trichoderma virens Gv29-8]